MLVVTTVSALGEALAGASGVEFVPTMGALHDGHLSLVRTANRGRSVGTGEVVVSIFVNPTQFNDPSDLRNYPRCPERDLEMLEKEGVDVVFMPTVEEIYPVIDTRQFRFGDLDKIMEGASRPGHFNGVAQVVSRLFDVVRPTRAYFGQKDYQQIQIIREMVRQGREGTEPWTGGEKQPWAGVEIVECPIVREADGLAMSSRNALLAPEYRTAAPDIYRALAMFGADATADVVREIERGGLLRVIYFEILDGRAFVAVQAGGVRLIDNFPIN